jgi:hypothetical protein
VTSSIEVVTSSIVDQSDGFCSESDADCSVKPTAAFLTQDDKVTILGFVYTSDFAVRFSSAMRFGHE